MNSNIVYSMYDCLTTIRILLIWLFWFSTLKYTFVYIFLTYKAYKILGIYIDCSQLYKFLPINRVFNIRITFFIFYSKMYLYFIYIYFTDFTIYPQNIRVHIMDKADKGKQIMNTIKKDINNHPLWLETDCFSRLNTAIIGINIQYQIKTN